jgi:heme iron utilization protein
MTQATAFPTDHVAPAEALRFPAPLRPVDAPRTRTAAEEARALVQTNTVATLATLSEDGTPWASLVTYGALADGSPVILVSTLAEHGRNLTREQRGSLSVAQAEIIGDPLDSGRVTLAGVWREARDDEERAAGQAAIEAASPAAAMYGRFGDFTLWILDVERVRWVGGFGRMDSADPATYAAAEEDPVAPSAAYAIRHLNEDHADALLDMARALAGYDDATAASCSRADRYGIDLTVSTPRGTAYTRVGFAEPATDPQGLRPATVELAKRARA